MPAAQLGHRMDSRTVARVGRLRRLPSGVARVGLAWAGWRPTHSYAIYVGPTVRPAWLLSNVAGGAVLIFGGRHTHLSARVHVRLMRPLVYTCGCAIVSCLVGSLGLKGDSDACSLFPPDILPLYREGAHKQSPSKSTTHLSRSWLVLVGGVGQRRGAP